MSIKMYIVFISKCNFSYTMNSCSVTHKALVQEPPEIFTHSNLNLWKLHIIIRSQDCKPNII